MALSKSVSIVAAGEHLDKGEYVVMQQQILVIEDETDVRVMLQMILTKHGYKAITAPNALVGLRAAYEHRPDAIILDIMMPDMDGFEACRRLREMTDTPIIMLTGLRSSTDDIVKGLDSGADEYMTKPFQTPELLSRLKVCLRRANGGSRDDSHYLFPSPSIMLNCGRHELVIDDRTISLSPGEFDVLELLVRHEGRILSRDAILSQVWGPQHIGDGRLVKQYIYQLRQKVEPDPTAPRYIHTIRGEGYYFAATEPDG